LPQDRIGGVPALTDEAIYELQEIINDLQHQLNVQSGRIAELERLLADSIRAQYEVVRRWEQK